MATDFSSVDLTDFTPSRSLNNCVNNDDISTIRIALFMEMNDKRLSTTALRQAIAWTLSKHPNLFVTYEENAYAQKMIFDTTQWNKDYYHMQEVYASSNFSLERIHHMVAVREHVFNLPLNEISSQPSRQKNTLNQPTQSKEQLSTESAQRTEFKTDNNVLKSLLLIGGVAAVIALVLLAIII